jgi:hypothetical protein
MQPIVSADISTGRPCGRDNDRLPHERDRESPRALKGSGYGPRELRRAQPVKIVDRTFLLVMVTVLSYGGRVLAHHSFAAEFDAQKPVTLKGTVVKWEMINPHGWITIDVTEPDGKTAQWMIETSNPNGLMRLGWSKRSLKPGDEITVEAYRAKDGSKTANAARVTLADGRKMFAGSSGTPAGTPGTSTQEK